MLITELSPKEALDVVTRAHLGRLACAKDGQPYIVPISLSYGDHYLYAASSEGQKIEWMRGNPLVCVEVDEVASSQQWISVVIYGCYEELPDNPEYQAKRQLAWSLLQRQPVWWEPGYVKTILAGTERPLVPLYFRIRVERITGHRGRPSELRLDPSST